MKLLRALNIKEEEQLLIAFTGAGGKSTAIYTLATELRNSSKKVLVTTTTMIFHPEVKNRPCDFFFTGSTKSIFNEYQTLKGTITVAGRGIIENGIKIKGFSPEELEIIRKLKIFDFILVEADGARGKPVKAPAEYEPVIPEITDIIVSVIGTDCFGTRINKENVHRPEIFKMITNSLNNTVIDQSIVIKLLESPKGAFKGTSPKSRKIVIFNKSETSYRFLTAEKIARNISESVDIERVLITSMTGNDYESYPGNIVPGKDLSNPPVMAVIEL